MSLSFISEEEDFSFHNSDCDFPVLPLREMDDAGRKEYWASLALRHCRLIGARTRKRLLHFYGSAYKAVENRKNWRNARVKQECVDEFARERWREPAKKEWNAAAKTSASIILWASRSFPSHVREIMDPPSYLYCQGDISLLNCPMIGIVGSRDASEYSLKTSYYLARTLSSKGLCIISGMALGIDRSAHIGALEEIGKSIGVLGTGINRAYPSQNLDVYKKMAESGLLLSEFSPDQPAAGINFPIRNRLISALSLGVVVVEAAAKSGSLITAKCALEQNREVFAVPGQAMNSRSIGCQNLVRQGAHPVFCADDILRELADLLKPFQSHLSDEFACPELPEPQSERKSRFKHDFSLNPSPEEDDFQGKEVVEISGKGELCDKILSCLSTGSKDIEELLENVHAEITEINSKLVFLEMLGKIRRLPGARFERI